MGGGGGGGGGVLFLFTYSLDFSYIHNGLSPNSSTNPNGSGGGGREQTFSLMAQTGGVDPLKAHFAQASHLYSAGNATICFVVTNLDNSIGQDLG